MIYRKVEIAKHELSKVQDTAVVLVPLVLVINLPVIALTFLWAIDWPHRDLIFLVSARFWYLNDIVTSYVILVSTDNKVTAKFHE